MFSALHVESSSTAAKDKVVKPVVVRITSSNRQSDECESAARDCGPISDCKVSPDARIRASRGDTKDHQSGASRFVTCNSNAGESETKIAVKRPTTTTDQKQPRCGGQNGLSPERPAQNCEKLRTDSCDESMSKGK